MKKIFLIIWLLSLTIITPAVAQTAPVCVWTLHAQCNDISSYYWKQSDYSSCQSPKPDKGNTEKCCCTTGCCFYHHENDRYSITKNSEKECQDFVNAKGQGWKMLTFTNNSHPDGAGYCATTTIPNINSSGSIDYDSLSSSTLDSLSSVSTDSLSSSLATDSLSSSNNSQSLDSYPNPLGVIDIRIIIGRIVRAILIIVGALALIMFVYGGFTWLTSAGNDQKVETGRNTLIWSSLGLIIVFSAYILVKYVMEAVGAI